ncbi:MAG: Unknown protein [uncultured Aureispira sp.]|uniref:non-specific serine/threonine protein kinase n=1 Tax=uncultured Aureispira sp. TaxID=1331704 RepID=A0A6S6STB2_9BACT|nr:MAG: Unknown protein [uncultured Aureispira sp.]
MSNKLHFYTKYSKEKIKISDKPFASGGEGAIYAIASPRSYSHLVAKIYYPEKRTPERAAKMQYLMQHPPITFQKGQPHSIGWVQDLVYKDKRFIGILLIKIEGKKLTKLTLFKLPRRADKAWQRFSLKDPGAFKLRLRTCFNLAVVIHQIHESGQYVLVDLKPDNVLMQPNGLLAVVDMDSVEVIQNDVAIFAAPVATPEYTPPEHYSGPRATIEETWDYFSLGVIFYQLLLGLHPFAASGNPPYDNLVSIHNKIENDLYVHHSKKQAFLNIVPPPHQQFYKMPVEIQGLFKDCFEYGAKEPTLRPSPADWCNVIADLLQLPFKKIPKTNIPPSSFYFSPKVLVETLSLRIPTLPENYSIPNLKSKDLAPIPPAFKKEILGDQLKVAYKKHLHKHREYLLQTVLVGIILTVLLFTFPMLFMVGLVLILLVAPQLFLSASRTGIGSVGKTILSQSTYQLLQLDEKNPLKKERLNSSKQLLLQLLSKKQKAVQDEKEQLSSNEKTNQIELAFIQEHIQLRDRLKEKNSALKHWVEDAEAEVSATRKVELEQYQVVNKAFLKELQNNPTYQSYDFSSFRSLRVKIQQKINALKGALRLHENPLEQLHLNQQRKLEQLKNVDHHAAIKAHRQGLENIAKSNLKIFKTKNQATDQHKKAYWAFTQKKKRLKDKKHQQQQRIEHQLNKSLQKIRKDLGLNSKSELIFYMDLLDHSKAACHLDFAALETRKYFDRFLQKIEALNIESIFSAKIVHLLTESPLPTVHFDSPQKTKSVRTLSDLQDNMTDTWTINQTKLEDFEKVLDKFVTTPILAKDPIELAYWATTAQEQLTKIRSTVDKYAKIQSVFYGDPVIFRLRNKLKIHREEAQNGTQEIQQLEEEYLSKLKVLEEKNSALIAEQKKVNQLKKVQEQLNIEKEKELKASVDHNVASYLEFLKKQQVESIKNAKKKHQKESELLEKQTKEQQATAALELKALEKTLEKLNLDYTTYETNIGAIRSNAELVYNKNRLLTDQKCQEASDLVHQIQKEHPKALQLIQKNILYYQELKNRIVEYKTHLDDLNQLQEEKIRLDTLTDWQEAYNSKIYIKDLFLNKVEQFEEFEQKKK